MLPKENPYLQNPELMLQISERAFKIESEIERFRGAQGDILLEDLGYDLTLQRILYQEDMDWQRRNDAYNVTSLIRMADRELKELQDTQRELRVPVGFDSLQHKVSPYSVICLLRQQIANWQAMGETHSNVTIYDVQAAMDRRFYVAFRGVKRKESGYTQQEVVSLFRFCELIDQAVLIDDSCDFQPKQWENVAIYDEFMQSITRISQEPDIQ